MFDLPAFVLALAFIVVAIAAWLLGRRNASHRTVRLPRDYYIGLDHLINDRFDHAAEVFARVAATDGDTTEVQFALGSLFRRRGEVDRAIAIHTQLHERGETAVREKAALALALDYQSAGLMDRAERLFEELAASREHRRTALDHLVRLYEQQGEWANALKIFHDLPSDLQVERRRVAAHYLCELAEHALLQGDSDRCATLLRQARTHDAELPRAEVLSARMMEATGSPTIALQMYLRAVEMSPGLALEIIPRVLALAQQLGERSVLENLTTRLQSTGSMTPRQLTWLMAAAVPVDEVKGDSATDPGVIGALLTRIGDIGGRYQCDDCGLQSVGWFWRCPKCRTWDSMRPAVFKWAERA